MIIRPETPADFAAIAQLNARAFGDRADEPVIVALLRQRNAYQPDLSLVAESDGQIIGHALFTPFSLPLLGEMVSGVLLAPLAVEPGAQRRGIGGALLEAGHAAARQRGAVVSFLLGHPSYYPRFGYQIRAFGMAKLSATPAGAAVDLTTRKPAESDLSALMALWDTEEGAVDFSVRPEAALLDWISPNPLITATVFERDGQIAGFSRIHAQSPAGPRLFLAADSSAAQAMVSWLAEHAGADALTLPLHPASVSAQALGAATVETFDPAMALALVPGALDSYFDALRSGTRPPGRPIWPPVFDLA